MESGTHRFAPGCSSFNGGSASRLLDWLVMLVASVALFGTMSCAPAMHENWVQVETQDIRLRSNRGQAQARKMAERLQAMHDVVYASVLSCGFAGPHEHVEVTSLSPGQFERISDPDRAGFFRPAFRGTMGRRADEIVLRDELGHQARQVFQHELSHRLIARCFPAAPIWLNEGMASFLETLQVSGRKLSIGFPAYHVSEYATMSSAALFHGQVIEQVPADVLPSARALIAMSPQDFYEPQHSDERELDQKRRGNYAAAWGLVHFLQLGSEARHAPFQRYLRGLMEGKDPRAVWRAEISTDRIDEQLTHYLLTSATDYLVRDYEPPNHDTPPVVRSLTPAQRELQLAWLFGFGEEELRAQARHRATRALGDEHTRAEAAHVLALTYLYGGDVDAATDRLDAGLSRAPDDANLLALWLSLSLTKRDQAAVAPKLVDRTRRLRRVASAPEHFAVLATHEASLGHAEQARGDSTRSIRTAPNCSECWEAHAIALASSGRFPEARGAAQRAAHLIPHPTQGRLTGLKQLERELAKLETEARQNQSEIRAPRSNEGKVIDFTIQ